MTSVTSTGGWGISNYTQCSLHASFLLPKQLQHLLVHGGASCVPSPCCRESQLRYYWEFHETPPSGTHPQVRRVCASRCPWACARRHTLVHCECAASLDAARVCRRRSWCA